MEKSHRNWGKRIENVSALTEIRFSEATVFLPMSRTPENQGSERASFPRFGDHLQSVVQPLAGTCRELPLNLWSANYNSEHLRANQLKSRMTSCVAQETVFVMSILKEGIGGVVYLRLIGIPALIGNGQCNYCFASAPLRYPSL